MKHFELGYKHGNLTSRHCSRSEVESRYPGWLSAEYDAYFAGRDDGVAKDNTRIKMRAAG
jgi:hypothetical protein